MKKHLKPSRSKLVENYTINNKITKLTKEARSYSKNSIIFSVLKVYVYILLLDVHFLPDWPKRIHKTSLKLQSQFPNVRVGIKTRILDPYDVCHGGTLPPCLQGMRSNS